MSGLKEKDKLTERTAGLERNRRERRTRKAAIYASQKSPTKRARLLNEELRRGQREDEELKGEKIELTAYHAVEINRKEISICYRAL